MIYRCLTSQAGSRRDGLGCAREPLERNSLQGSRCALSQEKRCFKKSSGQSGPMDRFLVLPREKQGLRRPATRMVQKVVALRFCHRASGRVSKSNWATHKMAGFPFKLPCKATHGLVGLFSSPPLPPMTPICVTPALNFEPHPTEAAELLKLARCEGQSRAASSTGLLRNGSWLKSRPQKLKNVFVFVFVFCVFCAGEGFSIEPQAKKKQTLVAEGSTATKQGVLLK